MLHLLLSRWTKTLNVGNLFPHRLEDKDVVESVAASKSGDSGLGICYCLSGQESQNLCDLLVSNWMCQRIQTLGSVSVSPLT